MIIHLLTHADSGISTLTDRVCCFHFLSQKVDDNLLLLTCWLKKKNRSSTSVSVTVIKSCNDTAIIQKYLNEAWAPSKMLDFSLLFRFVFWSLNDFRSGVSFSFLISLLISHQNKCVGRTRFVCVFLDEDRLTSHFGESGWSGYLARGHFTHIEIVSVLQANQGKSSPC